MAIQFFEEAASIQLDFAADYLKENPKENGKSYEVTEVRLTNAGSGYMVYTDVCTGFYYKKEKVLQQLLEALQVYVEGQDGYALFMVLDKKTKKGFSLGIDAEIKRNWFGCAKKYTLSAEGGLGLTEKPVNPFLPPVMLVKSKETESSDSVVTIQSGTRNKGKAS